MADKLAEYARKRHFDRTPEPSSARPAKTPRARARKAAGAHAGGHLFVVQKHAASHLHYDFRLELDGALKSWAIPKGPSLDPSVKRLAVHVEDHPLDYANFEGVIPAGNYGAGEVIVWDHGTWESVGDDADGAFARGKLKFTLTGKSFPAAGLLLKAICVAAVVARSRTPGCLSRNATGRLGPKTIFRLPRLALKASLAVLCLRRTVAKEDAREKSPSQQ